MSRNHSTDFIKSNSNEDPTIEKHDLKPISSICSNNILERREMIKVAVGLKNMGNTCFLNSTLQCLMHTAPLFNFLQSHAHEKSCNLKKFCMVCELKQLVKNCFNNGASSVAPQGILRNLKSIAGHLRWGRQEDAHEFLRYVIDAIHKSSPELKKHSVKKLPSVAEKIFQGDLESQIKCLQCQHVSIKCDPFLDVCIDVKNVSSIESGLQKFTAPETLQGENSYMCSNCKKKVKATKMFRLRRLPRVFTVQLKRYSPFGGKVSKHVSFPEVLDLAPYTTKKANGSLAEYELYAVLVHEGGSTKSGHYYCHVRGPGSKWFCMNDCHVSSISLQHVLRSQAYILFYVQKSNYLEKTCAAEKTFLNGLKMNASVLNKNMISLEPKLKKSLSMECLAVKDSNINKSKHLEHLQSKEVGNKIVPQTNLSAFPVLENGIVENGHSAKHEERSVDDRVSPQKSPTGEVNEVRSTTTWKVVEIGHDRAKQACGNKKFRSTCTWKVIDCEVEPETVPNFLENGFQCPTFDWDSKRHEVINKAEDDEKVSEELSNKKLTFGRPILTWNGEKSLLDSMENEDEFVSVRKRKWEEMDAEIDRGKDRKFKKKRHSRDISDAFRIHADRSYSKNCENGLHQVS